MVKKIKVLLIIAAVNCLSNQLFASSSKIYQTHCGLSFAKRISNIDSIVVDLTDIYELHNIKEFNDIYEHPIEYQDSVINYLQKHVGFEKKLIAICIMSNLPLDDYIKMLNNYHDLFKNRVISEKFLYRCIFNEFDSHNRIARQYKNPKLRLVLNKMLYNNRLSPDFKKNVRETLSGKWYKDLKRTGVLR